ncbi:hypothetical protein AMAG_03090 [Allomyces macrogynus ATCC 38327]|uniref:Uncharacterized protein n=1 Tax=Allomyces macrogynus (strain ATCC 38327) TaxID=578462 RepID=A0A0L0S4R1_ALLM3|nr:hypothetical protein AMAG_03090 [Allomyces macrogynus ATCC 38327]|eukprot:KNE57369.1 hypothetical protein AMAG_03090 [Allomyces macrogynus ATCC 38327]
MSGQLVPRFGHAAAILDSQLWLLGGQTSSSSMSQVLGVNLTQSFSIESPPYVEKAIPTLAPTAGNGFAFSACRPLSDTLIRCLGGLEGSNAFGSSLVDLLFDIKTSKWTSTTLATGSPAPGPRYEHALAYQNGSYWMYGGASSKPGNFKDLPTGILAELWKLDLAQNTWVSVSGGQWPPALAQFTLTALRSEPHLLVMIGGVTGSNALQSMNDIWVFNTKQQAWAKYTAQGDVPLARRGHAACSLGEYIYIHGGTDSAGETLYADMVALTYDAQANSFTWRNIYIPSQSDFPYKPKYPVGRVFHQLTCTSKQLFMTFGLASSNITASPSGSVIFNGQIQPWSSINIYSIESTPPDWQAQYAPSSAAGAVYGDPVPQVTLPESIVGPTSMWTIPVIVGIACAGVAVLAACIVFACYCRSRGRKQRHAKRLSTALSTAAMVNADRPGGLAPPPPPAAYQPVGRAATPDPPPATAPMMGHASGSSSKPPLRAESFTGSVPSSYAAMLGAGPSSGQLHTGSVPSLNVLYIGPAQAHPPVMAHRPVIPVIQHADRASMRGSIASESDEEYRVAAAGGGGGEMPLRPPSAASALVMTQPHGSAPALVLGKRTSGAGIQIDRTPNHPVQSQSPVLLKDLDDANSVMSVESGIQFA